jgi:TrmH family RNA methyltransferase
MNVEQITSHRNALMTHIRKLGSSRAYRMEHGEYLCDGVKMLQEAIQWHAPIRTAIFTDDVEIPALPEGVRTVRVDRELMRSVSPMETPQGALFTVALEEKALPPLLEGAH